MQAPPTIPTGIDGRPLSAESVVESAGADLDTCRAFAIAAMKQLDRTATRVAHAHVALAIHELDEALRELASS